MDKLPDDIDPALWIRCRQTAEQDFLVERKPHTFAGRMAAYCPHDPTFSDYNVSAAEVDDCSDEARWWIRGFVVGGEPDAPLDGEGYEVAEGDPPYQRWEAARAEYLESGYWPSDAPRRP